MFKRTQNLRRVIHYLLRRKRAPLIHIIFQCNSVYPLHHYIFTALSDRHIVYADNIGMRQHRHRLGFVYKPLYSLSVVCNLILQHFQGDSPFHNSVNCLEHHCHTTYADNSDDPVTTVKDLTDILVIYLHSYDLSFHQLNRPRSGLTQNFGSPPVSSDRKFIRYISPKELLCCRRLRLRLRNL